ncbi:MAG: SLBB domain-containing protein [Gemmatimonadetes bacterium]|nr:SLBB domain-containing protein [Gemmatimonadota bacterium]
MRRTPAPLLAALLIAGAVALAPLVTPAAGLRAQPATQTPAQPPAPPPSAATLQLRPGDYVRVAIWREPTLSGDVLVEEDSTSAFPLLGRRRTAGLAWRTVRDSLLAGYQRELTTTSIVVTPLRRIHVLGAVERPGSHLADLTVGVVDVVAMAGGPSEDGALDRVRVVRNGVTVSTRIGAGSSLSELDLRSGDQIIFDRRSWWDRNSVVLLTSMLSLMGVVAVLVRP